MKRKIFTASVSAALALSLLGAPGGNISVEAVGNGPNYNGNETVRNERLTNYEEMVKFLQKIDQQSDLLTVETFGQSVKGRDLNLVRFGNNPDNPTILFLTQQHGNEALGTEGALNVIQKLSSNSKEVRELAENVNVIFIPRLNVDGAEGDVNFDISNYAGGGQATRYNANEVDLNRDHDTLSQPETRALHENVLQEYDVDYLIDFHHQGTQSAVNDEYVSGSILYPTNPGVEDNVVNMSKQLGAVVYDAIEAKGYGTLGKYSGGTANTIARNKLAYDYDIATLLFEVRGMTDHEREDYILGQKSNGYLIQQTVVAMETAIEAIADGSIQQANTAFWDTLPEQTRKGEE